MKARALHRCIHVLDLEASLNFYEKALGLTVVRRMGPADHSWENVFIGNAENGFQIELTWNDGRTEPYVNGGRDTHIAFAVPDYEAAKALHEEMGCICFVNERMGLYFIEDPDGCWIEILPEGRSNNNSQVGVDVLRAMHHRRSVRKYTEEPIPANVLDQVVDAGLLSAAGRGIRPWEMVVIENNETLSALSECRVGAAKMLEGAAAAIVVLADPDAADTWIEDSSIVMANMHLAADAYGLGSCWIQVRMREASNGQTTQDYVTELLGIPENLQVEAILSLGYPAQEQKKREVPQELRAKIHRERY